MFCSNCGKELRSDAKFCDCCGAKVEKNQPKEEPLKQKNDGPVKEGKVFKCPFCGEILPYGSLKCPTCGNEIRGREAVLSVKEFSQKLETIENEDKKIETIKLFPIPNTKEDIIEFMTLAASNFDSRVYAEHKGETMASAWMAKIEQCYKKALILFSDPTDLAQIEAIYKHCYNDIKEKEKIAYIKDFGDKIASLKDENEKVEAIKFFPIPDEKEELLEFMIFISSNFNVNPDDLDERGNNSINDAWYTKTKQCYKKAQFVCEEKELEPFERVYNEIMAKIKKAKKNKRWKNFGHLLAKNPKLTMGIIGVLLLGISLLLIFFFPEQGSDAQAASNPVTYIGTVLFIIAIILMVVGFKKKKDK